jgi:hypothetical protein
MEPPIALNCIFISKESFPFCLSATGKGYHAGDFIANRNLRPGSQGVYLDAVLGGGNGRAATIPPPA